MEDIALRKQKGTTILIAIVLLFTYINIDSFDKKLNINIVNSIIILFFMVGLTFASLLVYIAMKKKHTSEEELTNTNVKRSWRVYLWIVVTLTTFINLSVTKHTSMVAFLENSAPLINLLLYISILIISYKYKVLNLIVFCTIINIPYVLSAFSFITAPILFALYVVFYVIATYLLIELTNPKSKLFLVNTKTGRSI